MRDYDRDNRYSNGFSGMGQGYQDQDWSMRRDEPSWGGMRSSQDDRQRGRYGNESGERWGQSRMNNSPSYDRGGWERDASGRGYGYGYGSEGQGYYGGRSDSQSYYGRSMPMMRDDWDDQRSMRGYRGYDDRDRSSGWERFKAEMQEAWDRLRGEPDRDRDRDYRMYGRYDDHRSRHEPSMWDRTRREAREGWERVKESFAGKGPKGYMRSDDRIREDVCDRLEASHDIDASEIEVSVSGGEVTLSGTVHERRLKRVAEDIVDDVPGVREVHNHLRTNRGMMGGDMNRSMGTGGSIATTGTSGATGTTSNAIGSSVHTGQRNNVAR